jgi:hypothetical protein
MANPILFVSVVVNAIIHGLVFSMKLPQPIFGTVMLVGLTTSLLNHGLTNNVAKYADRIVMSLAFVYDLLIAAQQEEYIAFLGLYIAVACYAISKLYYAPEFHILSHLALTGVHAVLILGSNH